MSSEVPFEFNAAECYDDDNLFMLNDVSFVEIVADLSPGSAFCSRNGGAACTFRVRGMQGTPHLSMVAVRIVCPKNVPNCTMCALDVVGTERLSDDQFLIRFKFRAPTTKHFVRGKLKPLRYRVEILNCGHFEIVVPTSARRSTIRSRDALE